MAEVNERAAKDCEFYGHRYVGRSVCVYCGTENPADPLPKYQPDPK